MKKVNITIELKEEDIIMFNLFMDARFKVIDFIILPDTKNLYETDPTFKALTKEYYKAKKVRNDYINKHNFNQDETK